MPSMKTIAVLLSICLCLTWSPVYATSPKEIGAKALRIGKKALMLPVYMVGGAGAGVIVWIHYGGEEGKLADLFAGAKKK